MENNLLMSKNRSDVMIKAYFAIKLACYLIVVLIVVMLVAAGIAAILIDKFKK